MTNSTVIKIYKNIKKFRLEKGYSQAKFAELTNLSEDYISLIENGKRTPSIKRLCIIAEVLGIEPYKLLK
ncbi:helix-turn-helix transcriptional regulator [bacterium]|nr:helix-turn-helix transcriptional regulator [bacterium]